MDKSFNTSGKNESGGSAHLVHLHGHSFYISLK